MVLTITGSLFLFALFASELKSYQFIGRDVPGAQTTISVNGEGEAFRAPDIAEISFSITKEAKTAAEARKVVDDSMKTIHAFLTESKVEDKDIKTTGYNMYPKYEWVRKPCFVDARAGATGLTYPCNDGNQVLTGYEVTQSVDVKLRKIDDAGTVLGGLNDKGATNISGPTFRVDNADAVKAEARTEAIKKAKLKARELADSLGVTLVRIVSFSEGGDYGVYNYARGGAEMMVKSMDAGAPAPADIPVGENKFISNVNIIYEIR